MKTSSVSFLLVAASLLLVAANVHAAITWDYNTYSFAVYGKYCDYPLSDINIFPAGLQACVAVCSITAKCTHFVVKQGKCYLKTKRVPVDMYPPNTKPYVQRLKIICGYMKRDAKCTPQAK